MRRGWPPSDWWDERARSGRGRHAPSAASLFVGRDASARIRTLSFFVLSVCGLETTHPGRPRPVAARKKVSASIALSVFCLLGVVIRFLLLFLFLPLASLGGISLSSLFLLFFLSVSLANTAASAGGRMRGVGRQEHGRHLDAAASHGSVPTEAESIVRGTDSHQRRQHLGHTTVRGRP